MNKYVKTLLLGIAAGAAIGVGGILFVISKAYIPGGGTYVGAALFPIGLITVCYLGLMLYTGKIGFLINEPNKKEFSIKLVIMLIGNIIGAAAIGLITYVCFKNNETVMKTISAITNNKCQGLIGESWFFDGLWCLAKSICCGALVFTAVYLFKLFKNHFLKILGVFVPIFAFVALGFEHCIANVFYFAFNFDFTNPNIYLNFFYAVVGNSIGALLLNYIIIGAKLFFGNKNKKAPNQDA